uniref:Uncharacterized protein n=1 Tax=Anguilla anguilla TaxID=7936 RepID=A0A0E9QCM2_ANGAN
MIQSLSAQGVLILLPNLAQLELSLQGLGRC